MTDPQAPTTEAGLTLLIQKHWALHAPLRGCVKPCSVALAIRAIEAEARAPFERLAAVVAYYLFSEDDSADDAMLSDAYDLLPWDFRRTMTEERVGRLVAGMLGEEERP